MMSDQQLDDEQAIAMVPLVEPKENAWKDILRPVTIFQVLQADSSPSLERDPSVYLILEGRRFGAVTLVAHVTSVEIKPAKAIYCLEDGTGRIHAEKFLDSLTHHSGQSPEAEDRETTQYRSFEHTYVEITCTFTKNNFNRLRMWIKSIHPVHGYYQVIYHVLHVIQSDMLTQQCILLYDSDEDFGPNENTVEVYMPVDDGQAYQDDICVQDHIITPVTPAFHAVLPNTFSPRKHQPYATLRPLERAIMKYMRHHRNHHVLIVDLAQAMQALYECTEPQFSLAFQSLLSEAYITSPLDDGHVVITPRY